MNVVLSRTSSGFIDSLSSDTQLDVRVSKKFELIQLEDPEIVPSYKIPCLNSRLIRNLTRVGIAGGLSAAGGWVSGFIRTSGGILGGAILSGVGNGASAYFSWEKKRDRLIETRITEDFPLIAEKVELLSSQMAHLNGFLETSDLSEEMREKEEAPLFVPERKMWCGATREQRNIIRLFAAGALSAAGSWYSGFDSSNTAIFVGGTLCGLGNALSTWMAFEKVHSETIRQSALTSLPHLADQVDREEKQLIECIERVQKIFPEYVLTQRENNPLRLSRKTPEISSWMSERNRWNFFYVNVAGWLSGLGSLVAGVFPTTPGILIGGTMGGAANSISAWFDWEKPKDKEVERLVLEEFPKTVSQITKLSQQIQQLEFNQNGSGAPV